MHDTSPPSDWLVRWAHLLPPEARVLDLACGRGRHTKWLAARGCRLTAVDRDAGAAESLAQAAEVVIADIEGGPWPLPGRRFDAVIVTNYLWRPLWREIGEAVAPGGWLLYETFSAGHERIGRPSRPDFVLQPGELLRVSQTLGLDVVAYESGQLSEPMRIVQRVVARRPAAAPEAGAPPLFGSPPAGG